MSDDLVVDNVEKKDAEVDNIEGEFVDKRDDDNGTNEDGNLKETIVNAFVADVNNAEGENNAQNEEKKNSDEVNTKAEQKIEENVNNAAEQKKEIKEPVKPAEAPTSPRFQRSMTNPSFTSHESRMKKYVEDIANYGIPPPEGKESDVIQYIDEQLLEAAKTRNYSNAAFYQRAIDRLNKKKKPVEVVEPNDGKLSNANSQINEINAKYDEMVRNKEAEVQLLRAKLDEQIQREEDEFGRKFENETVLRHYSKPSKELIHMRRQEEVYANSGMWVEAGQVKERAEVLERIEEREARNRVMEDMKIGYESMKIRHEKQIIGINDFREKELALIELKRGRALKHWNMYKKRSDVANPIIRRSAPVLFTPRQKNVTMKANTGSLNLGGLGVRQFIRTRQSSKHITMRGKI